MIIHSYNERRFPFLPGDPEPPLPRAPATAGEVNARRDVILDAAGVELAERGYRGATIRRIARRAGLAEGTIYNYFDGKEALLQGLLERLQRSEGRKLALGTRPPDDLRGIVEAWVAQRLEPAWERAELLRAVLPELLVDAELRRDYRRRTLAPSLQGVESFLERLRVAGRIGRDVDGATAARAVSGMILGLVILRLLEDDGLPPRPEDLVEPVAALLLEGLTGSTGDAGSGRS